MHISVYDASDFPLLIKLQYFGALKSLNIYVVKLAPPLTSTPLSNVMRNVAPNQVTSMDLFIHENIHYDREQCKKTLMELLPNLVDVTFQSYQI